MFLMKRCNVIQGPYVIKVTAYCVPMLDFIIQRNLKESLYVQEMRARCASFKFRKVKKKKKMSTWIFSFEVPNIGQLVTFLEL